MTDCPDRPVKEPDESIQDCSDETALITVDEFYDLLMEQQEQM